jgi:FkbM family methyltransferase
MNENVIKINGKIFSVSNDDRYQSFWRFFNDGSWESSTLNVIKNNLNHDDIYVDIGTWVGPTVLTAASTGCTVYGYEPDPVAFAELQANINLNKLERINIENAALFNHNGVMNFGSGRSTTLGDSVSSLMNGEGTISVKVIDVSDEIKKSCFINAKMLKIDIEGAEYLTLPKMSHFLKERKPIILLSIHNMKTSGCSGISGYFKMVVNRINILKTIGFYKFKYIESRKGWLDVNASWVPFDIYKKINFILSARGNRELLLSDFGVNLN